MTLEPRAEMQMGVVDDDPHSERGYARSAPAVEVLDEAAAVGLVASETTVLELGESGDGAAAVPPPRGLAERRGALARLGIVPPEPAGFRAHEGEDLHLLGDRRKRNLRGR